MLIRRFLFLAVIIFCLASVLAAEEIVVYIRNQPVEEKPLIIKGEFYLTLQILKSALGKEISVDSAANKVLIEGKATEIEPLQKNEKTYLPLKPIARYLGMKVVYNKGTGILDMCYDKPAKTKVVKFSSSVENYRLLGIRPEDKNKIMETAQDIIVLQELSLKFLEIRLGLTFSSKPKLVKTNKDRSYCHPQEPAYIEFNAGNELEYSLMELIHEHTHLWMYRNSKWPYATCYVMEEALPMWASYKFCQFVSSDLFERILRNSPEYLEAVNLFRMIESKYGEERVIDFFKNPYNYPEGRNWEPRGWWNYPDQQKF